MDNLSGAGLNTGGANVQPSVSPQASTAYSLAARVSIARDDGFVPAAPKTNTVQFDPAALAKAAIEDELRRKGGGGGGGGGFRRTDSYNPVLWIPYSFKLMAQAIDQSRAQLAQALQQILNFIPNTLNNLRNLVGTALANLGRTLTSPVTTLLAQLQKQSASLLEAIVKSPVNLAIALGSNVSHLANSIANALTQGFKKLIYGKDEKDEEFFENREEDMGIIDSFKNWIKSLKSDNN